eukprot:TRINITY_DN600_c0_g1_i8.p1 TRINITY_DN600_c0_g1~~TRINITY_DN600_c0_g1_i8.p1  ORF type:complete len:370 (+),score=45.24 TRINITY_DN600_c0_g1_i8:202-1311(+)
MQRVPTLLLILGVLLEPILSQDYDMIIQNVAVTDTLSLSVYFPILFGANECVEGRRGSNNTNGSPDFSFCKSSAFAGLMIDRCEFTTGTVPLPWTLLLLDPKPNVVFNTTIIPSSYSIVLDSTPLNPQRGVFNSPGVIDLCCMSNYVIEVTITREDVVDWGTGPITGYIDILFDLQILEGSEQFLSVGASRSCDFTTTNYLLNSTYVGNSTIQLDMISDLITPYGLGTWYILVSTMQNHDIQFTWSLDYSAEAYNPCPSGSFGECNGHGSCDYSAGVCDCFLCFSGSLCESFNNCSFNGQCDVLTGVCDCYNGYSGSNCQSGTNNKFIKGSLSPQRAAGLAFSMLFAGIAIGLIIVYFYQRRSGYTAMR